MPRNSCTVSQHAHAFPATTCSNASFSRKVLPPHLRKHAKSATDTQRCSQTCSKQTRRMQTQMARTAALAVTPGAMAALAARLPACLGQSVLSALLLAHLSQTLPMQSHQAKAPGSSLIMEPVRAVHLAKIVAAAMRAYASAHLCATSHQCGSSHPTLPASAGADARAATCCVPHFSAASTPKRSYALVGDLCRLQLSGAPHVRRPLLPLAALRLPRNSHVADAHTIVACAARGATTCALARSGGRR